MDVHLRDRVARLVCSVISPIGGKMSADPLTGRVIGCAIEVHKELGPGLLESAYERCLVYELQLIGLDCVSQHPVPVHYQGH